MTTITSSLRLQDNFTRTMRAALTATRSVTSAMEMANAAANSMQMGATFAAAQHNIDLAEREVDQFENELRSAGQQVEQIERKSRGAAKGIDLWGKAVVVANQGLQLAQQAWGAIDRQMSQTDALQSVNARLGLINDGLRTQQQLQNAVRQAANNTRSEYNATADLMAKINQTGIFASNDGALRFVEKLNKTLVVSGATAQEQQSAILQLSQSLGSGRLQGDELRSLSETAPMLMSYISRGLGVAQGQLKQMGADGELTASRVAQAILNMSDQIEADFAKMPMTFGQAMTLLGNKAGALRERLLQPGQALDRIIQQAMRVVEYLNTGQGMALLDSIGNGINRAVEAAMRMLEVFSSVYNYIAANWETLSPVFAALAAVIATVTVAQRLLNMAMLANPAMLIITGIIALIAAFAALWATNLEFRTGFMRVWNSILGFFDQVPIFFVRVGFGIANAFDNTKVMVLSIVDAMVNGVISAINWLIEQLNKLPGVSIQAINQVGFAAAAQAEAEANKQQRDQKIAGMVNEANQKAADREAQLQNDIAKWNADASAKAAQKQIETGTIAGSGSMAINDTAISSDGGSGGGSKSAQKQIDLAEQQIKYLKDIAEQETLSSFAAIAAMMDGLGEVRLSREDAELLRQSAGQSNVFYLNYQGGAMSAAANITQGENLEDIQRKLEAQAQEDIDTGLSGFYDLIPVP